MLKYKCKKCGEMKGLAKFYDQPGNLSGKSGSCKACTLAANKSRSRARKYAAMASTG